MQSSAQLRVVVVTGRLAGLLASPDGAQRAAGADVVDIPGLGPLDLDQEEERLPAAKRLAGRSGTAAHGLPTLPGGDQLRGPLSVVRQRLCAGNLSPVGAPEQVNQPPNLPAGVKDGALPRVVTDPNGNSVVTWTANLNDPYAWSAIVARSFDLQGNGSKNDFRVDLTPRGYSIFEPDLAPTWQSGRFVYVWTDDRSGRSEVYSRVVQSLSP